MIKLMEKFEVGLAGLLWAAATILLPMAALAPVDGRAGAATPASAACMSIAVDTLRACPLTSL
jgi:hypothetical protein